RRRRPESRAGVAGRAGLLPGDVRRRAHARLREPGRGRRHPGVRRHADRSDERRAPVHSRATRDPSGAPRQAGVLMTKALIFDLDGTLIDTVYAHVFAWQRALAESGLPIEGWRIHRRIGMSGGLFTPALAVELGRPLSDAEVEQIQGRHGELFRELMPE